MRLIDWDKVLEWMHRQKETMEQWSMRIAIENYVDEMPEVKAIPIEWINKWGEKFYKVINDRRHYMGDGYDSVWDMLEDWEKENENKN